MGITSYPNTPRLVNRFSLGADPEFSFHTAVGEYIHAETLGLTTGQAFGCDMAGRQAEIRAYPSRFALEVVASISDTLHWLAASNIAVNNLLWLAVGYNGYDGCGGHVHFGRKRHRSSRVKDGKLLDELTMLLLEAEIFDGFDWECRRQVHGGYGRMSDMRPQDHGFEYRTFPTELSTPWLTYFVLVLSKLIVHHGKKIEEGTIARLKLIHLLELYQDKDDDAAIALQALTNFGFPKLRKTDFTMAWGIRKNPLFNVLPDVPTYFPSVIQPEHGTCQSLFDYFTRMTVLSKERPLVTWHPEFLPADFTLVSVQQHTLGHLPDVGKDLICKGVALRIETGNRFKIQSGIRLPKDRIRQALSSRVSDITFESWAPKAICIYVPKEFKDSLAQCKFLNQVLRDSTLFPTCKAKDIANVNWLRWDQTQHTTIVKPPLGRLIARIEGKAAEPVKKL